MSLPFCQTCSSEIPRSSTSQPYLTPCCSAPICASCLARNPRLKEYIPCLRCGDVRTITGNARIQQGRQVVNQRREEMERGQFEIGDDEDRGGDEPPSYDDVSAGEQVKDPGGDEVEVESVQGVSGEEEKEVEMEVVEVKHPVSRSDTVLGIARRYAADPHDLLTLNNLPPTTLSAHPHLLHTRRTLLISRRLVPKSSLPSPLLFSNPDLDPVAAAQREKERQVKRFQLLTKTIDPGVGAAYLGLSEMEESRDVLDDGSGEGLEGGTARGKKVWREEGNRTERALEAFFEDEGWEREAGAPERAGTSSGLRKWKSVGSGVGGIKV